MGHIALFGGTFNPIHNGHVAMIKHLTTLPSIEKIIVMPTGLPPHKQVSVLASDADRLAMCRLAVAPFSGVTVSDLEIARQGFSYTVDTLHQLKQCFKNDTFSVIIGGDMLLTLDSWYRFNEWKHECGFLAFDRKGLDDGRLQKKAAELTADGVRVTLLKVDLPDCASSTIREALLSGRLATAYLPRAVEEYIREKHLYQ